MTTENLIQVACACGKRLKAPASAAGKKARCPACGATVVITASQSASSAPKVPVSAPPRTKTSVTAAPVAAKKPRPAPAPPPPPAHDDDGLGAMYELAEQAQAAPAIDEIRCPQCQTAMDANAILCTNCGYDTRTGKSLSAAPAGPPPAVLPYATPAKKGAIKTAKQVDRMAPDGSGSIVMGILFSALLALAASIVWIVVAWLTGFAIGYIAILIGIAAGVGMQIGHKGYSKAGGVIAACMTIFAILVAKMVVIELILQRDGKSISQLDPAALGYYFIRPMSLIIIAVGVAAAFRTANGSVKG